jgi:hypothetical protein
MNNKYQVSPSITVTGKELKEILGVYFSKLSNRTYRFLYLNIADPKFKTFVSVNIIGRDLTKIYNAEIRFRLIRLSNRRHFEVINWLIKKALYKKVNNRKMIYVVDILQIITCLNKLKYDIDKFVPTFSETGVGYYSFNEIDKPKTLSYVEKDIQSSLFVSELFNSYFAHMNTTDEDGVDISDKLLTPITEIKLDKTISLKLVNGLDYPNNKFLDKCKHNTIVKYIPSELGVKLVTMSRIETDSAKIDVLTSRVYITYYYKKRRKKNGKR